MLSPSADASPAGLFKFTEASERLLDALPASSSRNGELPSLSEEDSGVILGGIMLLEKGEPSYFLDRKPAWNRLFLLTPSIESGGGGIGEESGDWV